MTVTRWCESGSLPAIPKSYGTKTSYLISIQAVEMLLFQREQKKTEKKQQKKPTKEHKDLIRSWLNALEKGGLTGKVFSPRTIQDYKAYAEKFFRRYKELSADHLKQELMRVPAHQFAKREKLYKALVCLGKFLIQQETLEASFLEQVKSIRPVRHLPPKRASVDDGEMEALLNACQSEADRLIVLLLGQTGIRASEACAIRMTDIDFSKGILSIPCGKGGKTRRLGVSEMVLEAITAYRNGLPEHLRKEQLLINREGDLMDRHGLHRRLKRIGRNAEVSVSPHALRRYFATNNLLKGRPLPLVQRAMGHSDVSTTRAYCRDTEEQLIAAMKGW